MNMRTQGLVRLYAYRRNACVCVRFIISSKNDIMFNIKKYLNSRMVHTRNLTHI